MRLALSRDYLKGEPLGGIEGWPILDRTSLAKEQEGENGASLLRRLTQLPLLKPDEVGYRVTDIVVGVTPKAAGVTFDIVWTTDDTQWERARELATARIAVGGDQVLLDDFLVVGTMWFTLGGRFTRPVVLADPAIEAALRWTVWRGRSSPSPATTYFGAGFEDVLFEFAWQLALIVDQGVHAEADGKAPCYDMFDAELNLCFVKARGFVWIVSNNESDHGWAMPVPEAAFIDGARRFLRDFAAELDRRVPNILDAPVGDPIRPYRTEEAD